MQYRDHLDVWQQYKYYYLLFSKFHNKVHTLIVWSSDPVTMSGFLQQMSRPLIPALWKGYKKIENTFFFRGVFSFFFIGKEKRRRSSVSATRRSSFGLRHNDLMFYPLSDSKRLFGKIIFLVPLQISSSHSRGCCSKI